MESIKKLGKVLYKAYTGIGILAMGMLACCVIFTVIARYFFSLSWKQLEEFITTLFAFTTFWTLGIAVLENEHVSIDILFRSFSQTVQKWIGVFNYFVALAVDIVVCLYSFNYVSKVGNQISPGMGIPMRYMYGIMPVCFIICALCIVIRMVTVVLEKPAKPVGHTEAGALS